MQRKGGSVQEFIQCFCNKRNIIPFIHNKSIIMFFKKGCIEQSLIHKLAMKTHRTSAEMLVITNK
jgi:hypothetical protein